MFNAPHCITYLLVLGVCIFHQRSAIGRELANLVFIRAMGSSTQHGKFEEKFVTCEFVQAKPLDTHSIHFLSKF